MTRKIELHEELLTVLTLVKIKIVSNCKGTQFSQQDGTDDPWLTYLSVKMSE